MPKSIKKLVKIHLNEVHIHHNLGAHQNIELTQKQYPQEGETPMALQSQVSQQLLALQPIKAFRRA